MSQAQTIRLPWPPSVNNYWRSAVRGRRVHVFVDRPGIVFRDHVALLVRQRWPRLRDATRAKLAVSIVASPPDNRIRDLDNLQKATFDALSKAGVWADDSQIVGFAVVWGEVVEGGCVEVTIKAASGRVRHMGWEPVPEAEPPKREKALFD